METKKQREHLFRQTDTPAPQDVCLPILTESEYRSGLTSAMAETSVRLVAASFKGTKKRCPCEEHR